MVNQQLLDYIKQQLQQGISQENIKDTLLAEGWQKKDIEETFSLIGQPEQPLSSISSVKTSEKPIALIVSVILGVVIIAGGAFGYFYYFQKQTSEPSSKEDEQVNITSPTEVYLNYLDALNSDDIKTMKSLIIEKEGANSEDIAPEIEQQMLQFAKVATPLDIKVVNEIIEGERAILKVQGMQNPATRQESEVKDARSYGIIAFEKSDNEWKIYDMAWRNPVPLISTEEQENNGNTYTYWDIHHYCNNYSIVDCAKLDFELEKSMCYSCLAELKADVSLCEKVSVGFDKDSCYSDVAQLTGNKDLCENLSDEYNVRTACYSALEFSDFLKNTNIYTLDSDKDGLSDAFEIEYYTDMGNPDTDGDGFKDGEEIEKGYNPTGSGKLF